MATLIENSNRIKQALSDIRSAIIAKGGTAPTGRCETYADAVRSIPQGSSGTDVSDTTATEDDVLAPKVFHTADGVSTTGTIQSVDANEYTPSDTDQVINAGVYLAGAQTILGDPNLVAGNIKKDVPIFGVIGEFEGSGGGGGTDVSDTTATEDDVLLSKVFHKADGSRAVGTLVKGIDVSDTTASAGDVLRGKYFHKADGTLVEGSISRITVHDPTIRPESGRAFNSGYYPNFELDVDLTASDVSPGDVRSGKKFYDSGNNLQTGTLEVGPSDVTCGVLSVTFKNTYVIDTGFGSDLRHFNLYFKSSATSNNLITSSDWNSDDPTRYLVGYAYTTSSSHDGAWNSITQFAPASSYPQSHQAVIDVTNGVVTIKTAGTAAAGSGQIVWTAVKDVYASLD